MSILQEESELEETVRLVGIDALSKMERLILDTARSIREDFLHQNAFDEIDTYTSMKKQFLMLDLILYFHNKASNAIEKDNISNEKLNQLSVKNKIVRSKFISEDNLNEFQKIKDEIEKDIKSLTFNKAGKDE